MVIIIIIFKIIYLALIITTIYLMKKFWNIHQNDADEIVDDILLFIPIIALLILVLAAFIYEINEMFYLIRCMFIILFLLIVSNLKR